ncbi:hypothetical protein [Xanthomonas phage NEB7]|nr:hypothetical protein [Xanthomonas phage NEB7]
MFDPILIPVAFCAIALVLNALGFVLSFVAPNADRTITAMTCGATASVALSLLALVGCAFTL